MDKADCLYLKYISRICLPTNYFSLSSLFHSNLNIIVIFIMIPIFQSLRCTKMWPFLDKSKKTITKEEGSERWQHF